MQGLLLTHDVHDAQLVDRHQERIGRVDGLTLELRPGRPARVATILVGGGVRAARIGRWMVTLHRVLRAISRTREEGISRIPFRAVRCIGATIELDVDGASLPSEHTERWLAERVIGRIPGGDAGRK